ncbi:hypothetical protein [Vibrio anguillarum]|uniref:hypothetical protein n=1 Tax=Vibrio anguillarum TaxID=55601 RepID=UPI000BB4DB0C|nr:hypothetical protein [Vibrio anguillarum]ATC60294.1 hypothetical protein CMV05_23170 [Vibrio anguillarum]
MLNDQVIKKIETLTANREGSILVFDPNLVRDENDICLLGSSDTAKYLVLRKNAIQKSTNHVSYKEIAEILEIRKDSVRALVKRFSDAKLIKLNTDYVNPQLKLLKLYVECQDSQTLPVPRKPTAPVIKQSQSQSNLIGIQTQQSAAFNIASRYSRKFEPRETVSYYVEDSVVVNAVLGFQSTNQSSQNKDLSFHRVLPRESAKSHTKTIFSDDTENTSLGILLTTEGESVAHHVDILAIYAIFNLTFHYYQDTVGEFGELDDSITPIAMDSMASSLGKDVTQSKTRKLIDQQMRRIESTKFNLVAKKGRHERNIARSLFKIVAVDRYHYSNVEVIPRVYYLEFDLEVLKAFAAEKYYFLMPSEILASEAWTLALFIKARRIHKSRYLLQMDSDELRREFSEPDTTTNRSFVEKVIRYCNRNNSKITEREESGLQIREYQFFKAGMNFFFFIEKANRRTSVSCQIHIDHGQVYFHSLPEALREQIKNEIIPVGTELSTVSKERPIRHANATKMPLLLEKLKLFEEAKKSEIKRAKLMMQDQSASLAIPQPEDDEKDIVEAVYTDIEKSNEYTIGSYKLRTRKYMISISITESGSRNAHQMKMHVYNTDEEIEQFSRAISVITKIGFSKIQSHLMSRRLSLESIELNQREFTREEFDQLIKHLGNVDKLVVFDALLKFTAADRRRKASQYTSIEALATHLRKHL